MAAGLSIEEQHLDAFARAFDEEVTRWRDPSIPSNRVETDGELSSDEIALETAQALRDGGPWGQAFPGAVFRRHVRDQERARGGRQAPEDVGHHRATRRAASTPSRSISRAADENPPLPDGDVRLVYRLDINEYKGERRLQLLVDHVLR